jgi:hypothetical protein
MMTRLNFVALRVNFDFIALDAGAVTHGSQQSKKRSTTRN